MTAKSRLRAIATALIVGVSAMAIAAHLADAAGRGAPSQSAGGSAAEGGRFSSADRKQLETIIHAYIVDHPEVITEAFQALQEKEDAAGKAKAASVIDQRPKDIYNDGYSFVAGNPKSSVSVVEFFDYNCVHCREAFPKIMALLDTHEDVRLVFKEFPIFDGSDEAAKAAMAAARQGKYLEFHRALMVYDGRVSSQAIEDSAKKVGLDLAKLRKDMGDPLFAARLDANHKLGTDLGINGTPSFIVGKQLMPGWSASEFDSLIKKAREKKG
jgi:protein-disulfide isomerase